MLGEGGTLKKGTGASVTKYIWEKLVKQSETGSLTAELYRGCYTLMCMDVLRGAGVQVSSPWTQWSGEGSVPGSCPLPTAFLSASGPGIAKNHLSEGSPCIDQIS